MKPGNASNETEPASAAKPATGETFAVGETLVEIGGVLRCCHISVAQEFVKAGQRVKIGDESQCQYCHKKFRLVRVKPDESSGYTRRVLDKIPVWKPLWQLK